MFPAEGVVGTFMTLYGVHMQISLSFNPLDPSEFVAMETALAALKPNHADPSELRSVLHQVADPSKYGENRLGYLRLVAASGDAGIAVSQLKSDHFGGGHSGHGGTHSSIERSWRSLGGMRWAEELIDTVGGRQVMLAAARPIVLELLVSQ